MCAGLGSATITDCPNAGEERSEARQENVSLLSRKVLREVETQCVLAHSSPKFLHTETRLAKKEKERNLDGDHKRVTVDGKGKSFLTSPNSLHDSVSVSAIYASFSHL